MADKYVPIFYDWIEATQELKAQEKGRLIDAIVLYARGGDWSELLEGNERYVFPMFQLQIERAKNVSQKRSEARTNSNKTEQKKQNTTKSLTNTNTNTNTNTKTKTKTIGGNTRTKSPFVPPTVDEIKTYADSIGYNVDAQFFFDYYNTADWKRSDGSPVLNWKQTMQTWKKRDAGKQTQGRPNGWHNPALDYEQRDYSGTKPKPKSKVLNMETGEWEDIS